MKKKVILAVVLSLLVLSLGTAALIYVLSHEMFAPVSSSEVTGQMNKTEDSASKEADEEPQESVKPSPQEEKVEITLSVAGDVTLGNTQLQGYEGTFIEMYDNKGPSYFLSDVKSVFEKDDMTLVNFEGVLTKATKKMPKEFNLKGRPEFMEILPQGSVECVAFANNHRMDYYEEGSDETVEGFKKFDITYAYDDNVALYEVQGIKIGYVSVNTSHDEEVMDYVKNGIAKLKEDGANAILVYIHWGIELDHYPQNKHEKMGREFIDMGADAVFGAHPHVLQGVEIYNGKPICYSLGNFCFGGNKNPKRKDTMIWQQKLTFVDGELQTGLDAKVIPCTISSTDSRNDFCPTVQSGNRKSSILKDLESYSQKWGTKFTVDGEIVVE